jgi:hypothetical protein
MMEQQDAITAERRLTVLRTLQVSADYRMSDALLQTALAAVGCGVSIAVIKGDLAWLQSQGLVATTKLAGMTVAILRNEGVDVANGVSVVPGIARPRPE